MTTERIKEIQAETAYPNSTSVQQALLKVWNECDQERVKNCSIPDVSISLFCRCSQAKGRDNDENGTPYCIECQKPIDERQIL